jgi:3-deoxy-D-manno-octulosonic-acid transferase
MDMRFIIDYVYVLAGLAFSPVVLYRMVRHKRYRDGWAERFGRISRRNPSGKCIWLHAVSVGEVNAAKTLVAEIEKPVRRLRDRHQHDDRHRLRPGGQALRTQVAGLLLPVRLLVVMQRAFDRIRPSICLLMELEVWPNFLFTAHERGIPVVVLNGRISDKSFSRYRRIKRITRSFFGRIDRVLAQTPQYAERFRELGCPAERVIVTSSLKYDTAQVADGVEGAEALAEQLNLANARLWVAGGTGNDEEKIVLDVYNSLIRDAEFKDLRLAVVPRKPERFDEVAQLIEQQGFPLVRYSRLKGTAARAADDARAVILGDTMGDLRKFYSLAEVILVGRSLVPMGGSDMMEAAALGKCTLFGPHTFNFRQSVKALLEGRGAIEVADGDDLLATLRKCLSEPAYAKAVAQAGQTIIRENQGATAKTMEILRTLLQGH